MMQQNDCPPVDLLSCRQFGFLLLCPSAPGEVCSSLGFCLPFLLVEQLSVTGILLFPFVSPLVTLPTLFLALPAELLNFVHFFLSPLLSFPTMTIIEQFFTIEY